MMKRLAIVLLFAVTAYGQTTRRLASFDDEIVGATCPFYQVSTLPTTGQTGQTVTVVDALVVTSCATGGGTKRIQCTWNGAVWVPFDSPAGGASSWGSIGGTLSEQTDLQGVLNGKAASSHSHAESDVTGLTTALAGKAASSHSHAESDITGLATDLSGKAAASHSHSESDITGLTTDLAGKQASLGFTAVPDSRTVNSHALTGNVTVSASDVGLGSVANVLQYSASNAPPYPVSSVNTQTGAVSLVLAAAESGASHNFLTAYTATTGAFSKGQPAIADLSDASSVALTTSPSTAGTAPNWVSGVLNIPDAGTASVTAGTVSKTKYDAWDAKLGAAITSFNGLSGATQTFATPGTTGAAPSWSSTGTAHTLNIPMASASSVTAGLLSKTDYDTFNGKVGTHVLLSATHTDTTAASAVRGDGLFAIGTTPTWQRLAHGSTSGSYFKWNGTDIVASTLAAAGTGTPTACSNQFVTGLTLNADAAPTSTCTTDTLASAQHANQGTATTLLHGNASGNPAWSSVAAGDLGSLAYVKATFHAFCTGAVTASVTYYNFAGFGSSTTACTGVSAAAGGMKVPTAGTIKNLYVNLSAAGKANDKVQIYKNGSATGAPTCTYGTATTCNDVSTALAVVAGDVITIATTSGASDGSANIAVTFELWN